MTDLLLTWDPAEFAADLSIEANDLAADDGLETAVLLSLFTDREAAPGDVLPEGETDRRGWWGDAFPTVEGDKIGSRLWLLGRAKATPDVLSRAQEYAREALEWLVEDRVALKVDVTTEFLTGNRGLGIAVEIYRPGKNDPTAFRFGRTWAAQEARI